MGAVREVIDFILNLGPSIIMPFIIFIMAMIFQVPIGKAIRAGLTVGIGFIGINLVIGLMVETLGPAAEAMVSNLNINLTILDTGWPTAAAAAFSATTILPWIFGLGILLNILLIITKFTKTLNIDMWNYWQFIFGAAFIYAATNNFILSIVIGLVALVITLKLADMTAPKVQEFFGLPGVSLPHMQTMAWAPVGMVLDKVLDKIPGLNKLNADPDKIQKKYGILGEPLFIGTVLGALIGALAFFPQIMAGELESGISQLLTTAITLGAVMMIFPRMVRLLMEGLLPISDGAKKFLNKKFPGRELLIGLDVATVVGNPSVVATGLLLVPITLILAVVLSFSGINQLLPFTDLAVLPFFAVWAVVWSRGNLIRGVLIGSFFMAGILLIATFIAPLQTQLAEAASFNIPENASLISSLGGGSFLLPWLLMLPFISGSEWTLGIVIGIVILVAVSIFSYIYFFIPKLRKKEFEKNEDNKSQEKKTG
ncbi:MULTISPECIES: PTS galactitol transporter subunit IIC [Oceanobacillus]|uniref:PTS galactitol transporter subunit IIC n=1 Tax=Oceanobacillus sojae TaxID=582851 RepID=A0A511ZNF4_9BACI|nr:PTS transporter subunit IIC [Oceanobacillus sojae]GEN88980.1 PTS galactitol transporter subunit IIC [Oceanobacillus sojae]